MLRAVRIAAVVAIATLAGCPADDAPLDNFRIQLALDRDEPDATCADDARCSDFALGCPIVVGVRLLDLPDPDNPDAPLKPRAPAKCRRLTSSAPTLCALGDPVLFDVTFTNVRPERGMIELLVWRDIAVDADPQCPDVDFTVAGRPIVAPTDPNPPAFGRRVIYDFGGDDPIVRIPLACSQPAMVDDPTCTPATTDLRVDVDDIDDLLLGVSADKAPFLSVRVGRPTTSDGTSYEIVPEDFIELSRVQDNPDIRPFWAEPDVPEVFELGSDVCTIVTDFGSVPAVTCSKVETTGSVELFGYMVARDDWDLIRAALDLNVFPNDGLILGRVVDSNMLPLDGVVVTPSEPASAMLYLNEDKTSTDDGGGTPLAATTTSGYFVARGPSFATTWTASRAGGWEEVGKPTGGAIRQSLTALLLVMTQDLTP